MDGGDEGSKIDGGLQSLLDAAQREHANRQGGVAGAGGQSEPLRPLRHRVEIELAADTDGKAIVAWLEERGFSYEDHSDTGTIYAGVDITAIPDLSEVEGVFRLTEPVKHGPA